MNNKIRRYKYLTIKYIINFNFGVLNKKGGNKIKIEKGCLKKGCLELFR
jgi:hypothetical protein